VILENVPGFASSESAYLLKGFLEKLGYHVDIDVLDAAEHGGLTQRKRTVLVAQTPSATGFVPNPFPEKKHTTQTIGDILDEEVDPALWWDETTHPNRFERVRAAKEKGRGFVFQVVRPEDRRMGTFTAEYGNAKVDVPLLAHPTRPDTYRYFTLSEGLRIMGAEGYRLPEGQTYPWALLGQSVYVPMFREIASRVRASAQTEIEVMTSFERPFAIADDVRTEPKQSVLMF
jgi:site-specific DNA-cytosine methylase